MKILILLFVWKLVEAKKNRGENKNTKVKKKSNWKEERWNPDPQVENEEFRTFNTHPLVVQAGKLAKLTPDQNAVSTCRYILFKEPLEFHQAENKCGNLRWPITHKGKATLATVQNEDENNDVKTLIRIAFGFHTVDKHYAWRNWAFIGLSKRYNNTRPLTESEKGVFNPDEWFYQDNEKAKYWNFVFPMPDQSSQGPRKNREYQNWIAVNKKGLWDDKYSSKKLPYICQYCGKYVVMSYHARWDKAQGLCEEAGLHFATVNSREENDELWYAANQTLGTDIYQQRFNASNWMWIGEKKNTVNGIWEHYDGAQFEVSFEPQWDFKDQPDEMTTARGSQRVVALSRISGKWDDSFHFKERPFACMCPPDTCSVTD